MIIFRAWTIWRKSVLRSVEDGTLKHVLCCHADLTTNCGICKFCFLLSSPSLTPVIQVSLVEDNLGANDAYSNFCVLGNFFARIIWSNFNNPEFFWKFTPGEYYALRLRRKCKLSNGATRKSVRLITSVIYWQVKVNEDKCHVFFIN